MVAVRQHQLSRTTTGPDGHINFVDGRIARTADAANGATGAVDTPLGMLAFEDGKEIPEGTKVTVAIRPENLWLVDGEANDATNLVEGEVSEVVFLGDSLDCRAVVQSIELGLRLHPSNAVKVGDRLRMRVAPQDISVLAG